MHEHDAAARQRFLEAMRGGSTVTAAARTAGVARQTPYAWAEKGDSDVDAALEAAKGRGGRGRPKAPAADPDADDLRTLALAQLRGVLTSAEAEDRDKISAARVVLSATNPPKASPAAPAASAGPGGVVEDPARQARRVAALEEGQALLRSLKGGA